MNVYMGVTRERALSINIFIFIKDVEAGTSPVVKRLRIRLAMQGTRVRALVWEDPTCRGATKPTHHNY